MRHLLKRPAAFILSVAVLFLSACAAPKAPSGDAVPVEAVVVEVEKYGHAVLDLTAADFAGKGYALGDVVRVRFGSFEADMPYYDGYYSDPGEMMLRGRSPEDRIALCINYGDFSAEAGLAVGGTVEITMAEKGGMLATQDICSLVYSNDRADYSDDAVFANFRAVTAGRIADHRLYRSASPINNEYGRAAYADRLLAAAGVATVLNLADSSEDIGEFFAEDGFDSPYYRGLYDAGKVMPLDLGNNFFTEEFAASVAEGLTFLAQNDPPYCIHCTEGKDRAGFTAMLLEALMGAEPDEIIRDYMLSFSNYYGITEETQPERYQTVFEKNLCEMLCYITGADDCSSLSQQELEAAAINYLLDAGMAEADIAALQEKLGG